MSHDPTQDIPPGQARLLLTPGPLTTAPATRRAMLRDWGSRDGDFIRLTRDVLDRLVRIACLETRRASLPGRPAATDAFVAVPVQGSGTFAVEATLATLIAPENRTLVLINGAYGRRIETILQRQRKRVVTLTWAEDVPIAPRDVARTLEREADITHVVMVHCETTSGILNPLADVARVCRAAGRALIVDAMSSFGALPLDAARLGLAAVIASSNKCLEGVPGLGFAVIRREELAGCAGNSASLSFDLYEQKSGAGGDRPVAVHAAHACPGRAGRSACRARGGGRCRRALSTLCHELPDPGGRHGQTRLRAASAPGLAGADHRDLSHAGRARFQLPRILRCAGRAGDL